MATKFSVKAEKPKHREPSNYVIEREWKAEARKVAGLEKELREHEKTDAAHAHPMHRSHEAQGGSQKDAPLPNMRKF